MKTKIIILILMFSSHHFLVKAQSIANNSSKLDARLNNVLSYVINTALGKSFYDLINEYRIEKFINLYQDSYDKYTILALALDSGFNSKSAFNRNFKKIKGITPSEFISKANIQASFISIS